MTSALALLLTLAAAPASAAADLQPLRWLSGCWEGGEGDRTIEEQWMAPRGDSLLGVSRTVRAGKLVTHELLIVRADGGRLALEARPAGQPAAVFHALRLAAREVVFENAQHDFPQRIGYRRDGDRLFAFIEGTHQGRPRRRDFPYRRVTCPGE